MIAPSWFRFPALGRRWSTWHLAATELDGATAAVGICGVAVRGVGGIDTAAAEPPKARCVNCLRAIARRVA